MITVIITDEKYDKYNTNAYEYTNSDASEFQLKMFQLKYRQRSSL